MFIKRKSISIFLAVFLIMSFSCCGGLAPQQENNNSESSASKNREITSDNPYISITYGRNNPDNFTGRDMVFYSYDMVTKKLTEECVIPFDSKYASGVVSKADNIIYYSGRAEAENLSSNDSLIAYNIATQESTVLETENFSYNEITHIDQNTLLVMAVTNEHPIMPALFDLKTRTFIYMPDANKESFTLYTSGDSPINYNYNTRSFVNIYQNEKERYSTEYHRFESEINTYIALVNDDLTKVPNRTFSISLLIGHFIDNAVQISENELLVERTDDSTDSGEYIRKRSFYSLVFEADGKTTFTSVEPPFPAEEVRSKGYRTVDGGKTWYLILGEKNSTEAGLYAYDTETEELTPILLNDPSAEGYIINFSIIGP